MDHEYGQCSDPNQYPYQYSYPNDETEVEAETLQLASSCPKKKAGRKKFKETRHPVYRGVRQRNGNRWVCEVRSPTDQTRIWLGTYPVAEMAARAHDVAALALRGRNACLNFADSAWCLPIPATSDTRDIQRAAAEAAELFRPQDDQHSEEQTHGGGGDDGMMNGSSSGGGGGGGGGGYGEGSYVDDEAVYNMPGLLTNMAEGLLLSPPHASQYYGGGFTNNWEESESDYGDVSLWSY